MTSRTTERFRKTFALLPHKTPEQARHVYHLFQKNPQHPAYVIAKSIRLCPFIPHESAYITGLWEYVTGKKSYGYGLAHTRNMTISSRSFSR